MLHINCKEYLPTEKIMMVTHHPVEGRWGYSCKQEGINLCTGAAICFQNDDNYVCPGFMAQMVAEINRGHDLVLCDMAHSYHAWEVLRAEPRRGQVDLCSWMAKAELVKGIPWPGTMRGRDFAESDGEFVELMAAKCGTSKIAKIRRPLLCHN
jgi:hypothetical protein